MNRKLILVLLISLPISACLQKPTTRSANQSSSTDGKNGSAYAAAAAKVTDACTLMPADLAEFISGLAQRGYLERLDSVSRGDIYLTVILGKNPNGLLHVEVAGHDGKDRKDDAIAVARDILAHLR